MPISHEYSCVYVHIPKTGGSSIEAALGLGRGNELYGFEDTNGRRLTWSEKLERSSTEQRHLVNLQHLTAQEIRDRYPSSVWSSYLTFSIVRNPFDLEISRYSYITQRREDLRERLALGADATFREFLEARFAARTRRNSRWRPLQQWDFLTDEDGIQIVDYVGRFETLENDVREICSRLGISRDLPHTNRSSRSAAHDYYDDWSIEHVAELYATDLDRLGYSFPGGPPPPPMIRETKAE